MIRLLAYLFLCFTLGYEVINAALYGRIYSYILLSSTGAPNCGRFSSETTFSIPCDNYDSIFALLRGMLSMQSSCECVDLLRI
jgi:hypothetical protein